jgi:hypothetical protein
LDASDETLSVIDEQIGFVVSVFFGDPDMVDMIAEASGVVLLEEALLPPTLGTPDQAYRATPAPREHDA